MIKNNWPQILFAVAAFASLAKASTRHGKAVLEEKMSKEKAKIVGAILHIVFLLICMTMGVIAYKGGARGGWAVCYVAFISFYSFWSLTRSLERNTTRRFSFWREPGYQVVAQTTLYLSGFWGTL